MRTLTLRRTAPAVALFAASAMLLAGCGDDGDDTTAESSNCTEYKSGDATDAVKVTGDFGKTQTLDLDGALKATELERKVLSEGDGEETEDGDKVDTLITAFNGTDGKALGTQPLPLTVGEKSTLGAFAAGVDCVKIGSRVVVVVPAKDVYGEAGNEQIGIKGTDALVIVTDVISEQKPLTPADWTTGVPDVTFDKDGKPTVKLTGKPEADLLLKVLEAGDGDEVKSGDQVTVDYQGTSWDTKKIFDQSYGRAPATFSTDQVVPGFGAALVGQKVGTRLIVTIPPKYAYGEKGQGGGSELEGQTLVFVIEIKATTGAS